jgi:hypothetical protein
MKKTIILLVILVSYVLCYSNSVKNNFTPIVFDTMDKVDSVVNSFYNNKSNITPIFLTDENQVLGKEADIEILSYNYNSLTVLEIVYYGNLGKIKYEVFFYDNIQIKIKRVIEDYDKPYTVSGFSIIKETVEEYYYLSNDNYIFKLDGVQQNVFPNEYYLNSDKVNSFQNFYSNI